MSVVRWLVGSMQQQQLSMSVLRVQYSICEVKGVSAVVAPRRAANPPAEVRRHWPGPIGWCEEDFTKWFSRLRTRQGTVLRLVGSGTAGPAGPGGI